VVGGCAKEAVLVSFCVLQRGQPLVRGLSLEHVENEVLVKANALHLKTESGEVGVCEALKVSAPMGPLQSDQPFPLGVLI
jgi:hypothetical protein